MAQRKAKADKKKRRNDLFKQACKEWQGEITKKQEAKSEDFEYKTKSPETICAEINRSEEAIAFGIIINSRSVRAYVKAGKGGQDLQRQGPKGKIDEKHYNALCAAVKSYCVLTQQAGTTAAVLRPKLVKKVNACVNKKEGFRERKTRQLYSRIERDIADELQVGKPNRVEQRRNKWSTYANINLWFSSFKCWLIEMGFALDKPDGNSEITWVSPDQGRRICNIDETKITLDSTDPGVGGRPAAGLFHGRVANAPTQGAHKSSYAATMIGGAFASGEKFPEHFQLPSDAKELDREGFGIEFIEDMLLTKARYLGDNVRVFSATHGVNEKGGMNQHDFGKYIFKNFVPLVRDDVADIPGKRVVLLVDGGPGRVNVEMLTRLKLMGIYLYPCGPPNTTHILQVWCRQNPPLVVAFYCRISYSDLTIAPALLAVNHRSWICSSACSKLLTLITLMRSADAGLSSGSTAAFKAPIFFGSGSISTGSRSLVSSPL